MQFEKLRAGLVQHVAYGLLTIVYEHVAEHGWNEIAIKDALVLLGEIKECKITLGEDLTDTIELIGKLKTGEEGATV